MSENLYWHFLPNNGKLGRGDGRKVIVGETLRVDGAPVLCDHGLHASERIIDAIPTRAVWKRCGLSGCGLIVLLQMRSWMLLGMLLGLLGMLLGILLGLLGMLLGMLLGLLGLLLGMLLGLLKMSG